MGYIKGGLNTKIHLAVDAHSMLTRVIITSGTTADCRKACKLINGIEAKALIANKGDETDAIVDLVSKRWKL